MTGNVSLLWMVRPAVASAGALHKPDGTWTFGDGTVSTTLSVLGPVSYDIDSLPIKPAYNATPAWPAGTWTATVPASTAKVVSGSTTYLTITYPGEPKYTFSVAKGTAYNRDWRFKP